jgi:SAM-dependent methyltransferase
VTVFGATPLFKARWHDRHPGGDKTKVKLCLACKRDFESEAWTCPNCGHAPERREDVLFFAPELSTSDEGFSVETHAELDSLHDASFWFRSRNRLIADLARHFFWDASAVIEVGCGTGYVLGALARALPGARIAGSEIHESALRFARRRNPGVGDLFQLDACALPFTDAFDLICAFDVLEHIETDDAALAEMYRALRTGGGLLLSVPQHPSLWSRNDELAHHKRRYRRGELEAKCRKAGFDVVMSSSFVSTLVPVMALRRLTEGQKADYDPGGEMTLPVWLDRGFEALLEMERMFIMRGGRLPVGGSRFVVAKKQPSGPIA